MAKELPKNSTLDTNASMSVKMAALTTNEKSTFHYLPLTSIEINSKNARFRELDAGDTDNNELKALMISIAERGLYHPLLVKSNNGKYTILSGERRYRAISLIPEEQRKEVFPSGIPCMVFKSESEIEEQIMIDEANLMARRYTDDVLLEMMDHLCDLYEAAEGKDKKDLRPVIKERIQKISGIGQRKAETLSRYASIIPEFREAVKSQKITLDELSGVSAFDDSEQKYLFNAFEITGTIDKTELDFLRKQKKKKKLVISRANDKSKSMTEGDASVFISEKTEKVSSELSREREERLKQLQEPKKTIYTKESPDQRLKLIKRIQKDTKTLKDSSEDEIEIKDLADKVLSYIDQLLCLIEQK